MESIPEVRVKNASRTVEGEPVKYAMRPKKVNFEDAWVRVKDVIEKVMTQQQITTKTWDDCFFEIYAICTVKHAPAFYANLVQYFYDFVDVIKSCLVDLNGTDLLEAYSQRWRRFDIGIQHIHELCGYANKMIKRPIHWKLFERDNERLAEELEGEPMKICELGRFIWRKRLILPLKDQLYSVLWQAFMKGRESNLQQIPPNSVRNTLDSFIDVCYANDSEKSMVTEMCDLLAAPVSGIAPVNEELIEKLKFYQEIFEDKFLSDTDDYVKTRLADDLSDVELREYMRKATDILQLEEKLCEPMVFPYTVAKLVKMLREKLVHHELDRFVEVIPQYVKTEQREELKLAYQLLGPFDQGLRILIDEFEGYVKKQMSDQFHTGSRLMPQTLVEIIFEKHKFFQKYMQEVFNSDPAMEVAYRRAMEQVINEEHFGDKYFSAKTLARYCDSILKKRRDKYNAEDKLDEALVGFGFLRDKDTFLKWFQRLMSSRLLGGLSNDLELESFILDRLRRTCGSDYTSKLIRMFTDYHSSHKIVYDFNNSWLDDNWCQHKHSLEHAFTILQTCAWPVVSSAEDPAMANFKVPADLSVFTDCFTKFYVARHSGRALRMAYHVSYVDVETTLGGARCIAAMTVPQAVLLFQFNDANFRTIQHLMNESGLPFEYVCLCLRGFFESKFLKDDGNEGYTPESVVELNLKFKPTRARINIHAPSNNQRPQESGPVPTQRETMQDRKVAVECTIVRALKARKVIKHEDLVQFVRTTVRNRFVPDLSFIKMCIEGLIDRHFIQRTDTVDEYEYLA